MKGKTALKERFGIDSDEEDSMIMSNDDRLLWYEIYDYWKQEKDEQGDDING